MDLHIFTFRHQFLFGSQTSFHCNNCQVNLKENNFYLVLLLFIAFYVLFKISGCVVVQICFDFVNYLMNFQAVKG